MNLEYLLFIDRVLIVREEGAYLFCIFSDLGLLLPADSDKLADTLGVVAVH